MSKILITGNGFDLFHHLPTKYHHFISIMETIEKFQPSKEATFGDLFGRIFKDKYLDDYNSIIDNYNVEQIKFDNSKIKQIDELLKTNLWYKYFKTVLEIDTWIDFEMEIEYVLNQLAIFNKYEDKSVIRKNYFSDSLMKETDFEIFNVLTFFSFEIFKLKEEYINVRKGSINFKKIIEDLAKSFEEFIVIFNRYLVDIVGVFYAETKEKIEIPFHLMNEIYTFNYTPTLENIYKVGKSKVIYLHGEINEDCGKQNIVLGISEMPKDVKASKMFDFTKYYQKVNKNSNNKFIEIPKSAKDIFDEKIFYIIGHSLDESDKEYIIDLFEFLKIDKTEYSKICVFYYNAKDKENKWKNLFSIIDKNTILEMNKFGRLYFVELKAENINREFGRETYTISDSFFIF
ncbi:AbiH family protein [Flavobacterium sp.]|uniref:AbiH family protein n=1 Tax=Flavobacterium sp. TaxID=239 RepID=UPI0025B8BFF2|nr:AbiH family protein [Flavobacterium sp.]MBA4275335.1 hypothetical protein [Flavobacterium sp.]